MHDLGIRGTHMLAATAHPSVDDHPSAAKHLVSRLIHVGKPLAQGACKGGQLYFMGKLYPFMIRSDEMLGPLLGGRAMYDSA